MPAHPLLSLPDILTTNRPQDTVVAFRGTTELNLAALRRDAASLAHKVTKAGGGDWLIASDDGWDIAVSFLAVLHGGGRPVFPANLQEGHLQDLSRKMSGVIGWSGTRITSLSTDPFLPDGMPSFDVREATAILHTSGSTGRPEAFTKPIHCLQAEVETLHATFSNGAYHTYLATVPGYHIYGLLFRILWPLMAGWRFDAETIRYPEEVESRIVKHASCRLVSSPAFLKRSVDVFNWKGIEPLRGVFSSGGPLDPAVAEVYNTRLPVPVREVYGSTETGGIGHRVVTDAKAPPPWVPLENVRLDRSTDGTLRVSSPYVDGGAFQTEDLVDLHADGRFVLKGRADRVVKIEERRISLTEIETRLQMTNWVDEARCLPLTKEARTIVAAVIVLSDLGWGELRRVGKLEFTRRLRSELGGHIVPAGHPRRWRFVGSLPLNTQGKLTQASLIALFETDAGKHLSPKMTNIVREDVKAVLSIEPEAHLDWFDGHFDVAPILPGLGQVTWAIDQAQSIFQIEEKFERLEVVKFFEVVSPGTALTLELIHEPEKSRVLFHYSSDHADHAKGRIVFGGQT